MTVLTVFSRWYSRALDSSSFSCLYPSFRDDLSLDLELSNRLFMFGFILRVNWSQSHFRSSGINQILKKYTYIEYNTCPSSTSNNTFTYTLYPPPPKKKKKQNKNKPLSKMTQTSLAIILHAPPLKPHPIPENKQRYIYRVIKFSHRFIYVDIKT